ncbi:Benzoate--CoA ligase [Planctomycetes bacterium Pla163]|uniref:Benzoate--CoA ligase n=1 Tax=Rohdeia mirabilis TaxID=2528008 RepID=A0A518CY81_9BACT|nr:Benzoate--CoA ligase [Planctomycetes bacterium Pla163]
MSEIRLDASGELDLALPERFNLAEYYLDEPAATHGPDRVALEVHGESRTYAQLIDGSKRMAALLRRLGVRREERVLICLPDGFAYSDAFFGVLRAGAAFAMVSPLLKEESYAEYLDYVNCRVAIVHAETLEQMAPAFARSESCEHLIVVGGAAGAAPGHIDATSALAAEDPSSPAARTAATGPDDLAGWLFTSGSTGRPKGCVHVQRDYAYSTETYAKNVVGYGPDDVCVGVPKLFFGYATGTNLMFPLRFGGRAGLFPERSTPDALFDAIERHRPTVLTSVPTMINAMLRHERIATADLSSLRLVLSAGEALPEALAKAWMERTGTEILDGIGSAEMFHIYISNHPGDVKPGSLGRVVEGYEARIVDDTGAPVPDGEPGRLAVRGGSTALCYWANKQASNETFQGAWCVSADVFKRDADGYYTYEGRSDDLLKVSGIFVSPLEIENALLSHAAVDEVCIVAREDAGGLVKPQAFVVPASGVRGDEALAAELVTHVKTTLAPHKYPRWFEWVDDLPKNDRGKVDRKVMRARVERGEVQA